ncbi:transmembrane protein [Anaeramoeba ignava]|uniref:Transmembrane protein n=1 Tax=Anaeramoeba ignava TaxID=1746090 RepID=A0A9Q0RI95_ANAIG|nr:transmembrane protein [Anaeramoeba ignava]
MIENNSQKPSDSVNIKTKIFEAILLWILTILVFTKGELWLTLTSEEENVSSFWFYMSLLCFIFFFGSFFYLVFYIPLFKKKKVDWSYEIISTKHGKILKISTASTVLFIPFFIFAIWPVYRLSSIPITILLWSTFLFTVSFIPVH